MKINVLNTGFVELVDKMGSDLSVVNAARGSFGKRSDKLDDKDIKLIKYLVDHNHTSPFRHCTVQLNVKAPEIVARQWYKHIIGGEYTFKDTAWNEISGRYIEYKPEFYIPETFRKQSKSNKQGSIEESAGDFTNTYLDACEFAFSKYKLMIDSGVCREQARAVLPVATYTEWYVTWSLQAVSHFVSLRNKPDAQWEIKQYAIAIDKIMKECYPYSWNYLMNKSGDNNG